MARCFLDNACLDKKNWMYALNMAFYVKNMLLHSALEKTPFEMMYNENPNYLSSNFLVVCNLCILKNHFAKNLDQTSKKGIFLENFDNNKCYLIGIEDEKRELKIQKSRNVRFNENEFYFKQKKNTKVSRRH